MIKIKSQGGRTFSFESDQGSLLVFPEGGKGKSQKDGVHVLLSSFENIDVSGTVSWAGEYDYGGMAIIALAQGEEEQLSYIVSTENMRCGFLSSPLREWSEGDIERLGALDVLILPADDAKLVQKIVEEVDPPVVIPLKTKDEKTYRETLAASGAKDAEPVDEVKLKKSSLPTETREVYAFQS